MQRAKYVGPQVVAAGDYIIYSGWSEKELTRLEMMEGVSSFEKILVLFFIYFTDGVLWEHGNLPLQGHRMVFLSWVYCPHSSKLIEAPGRVVDNSDCTKEAACSRRLYI